MVFMVDWGTTIIKSQPQHTFCSKHTSSGISVIRKEIGFAGRAVLEHLSTKVRLRNHCRLPFYENRIPQKFPANTSQTK